MAAIGSVALMTQVSNNDGCKEIGGLFTGMAFDILESVKLSKAAA